MLVQFLFNVNCLENSTDPNYFVAFAVNSIDLYGCPTAISDNLFQDGTVTPASCLPDALRGRDASA